MGAKTADNKAAQQAWVRSVRALYAALKAFVKDRHTTCLMWNTGAAQGASSGGGAAPATAGGSGSGAGLAGGACFDAHTGEALAAYLAASKALGGPVQAQAASLADAFKAEAALLESVSKTPKPKDAAAALQPLLEPIGRAMGAAAVYGSSWAPRDALFNHLTGVGESVGVLGWVAVDSKPVSYINDMEGAGDFYLNKALMGAKTANNKAAQQAWVRSVRALYAALKAYVKEHHSVCLTWNTAQ
ncbi:hypothetical protein BU14_2124s0001 [Porphyra umbilicalis]|uniref:CAP N-terminal domain-containing protein n=1 Tax=Porphyra umbilicalis TaxID=2786 RepID=A0A1X6NK25_PORUM|nr:hypothetical protein BU14_2124s0001 [Porphyra umbilicalis]|eukprot:OSX68890.1 hypothetical protein BU14_2124s0001 [Porphyra umbilicalis]